MGQGAQVPQFHLICERQEPHISILHFLLLRKFVIVSVPTAKGEYAILTF